MGAPRGESGMTVQKLNHVAYRCRDARETAEFYTEVLGLPLRHTIVQDYVPSTKANDPAPISAPT